MGDNIIVEFNGEEYEFEAGTSDDDIYRFLDQISNQKQYANTPIVEVYGGVNSPKEQDKGITSGFLMGLKDPINAGAQLLPRGLAGLTSGFGYAPNPVSQFFDDEAKRVDDMVKFDEKQYQANRMAAMNNTLSGQIAPETELPFDWSRLGGNIASPANLVAGLRAGQAAKAAGASFLGQSAAAGAAGGVLSPVTNTEEFAKEKGTQVVFGGVTGAAGAKGIEYLGRVLSPAVSEAEKVVRSLGVRLTPGETLGGTWRTMEELAQNLPFVGDMVKNQRDRAMVDFNRGVINKMLDKIGLQLPKDAQGRNAVKLASDAIDQSYDLVLNNMNYTLDSNASRNILAALNNSKLVSGADRQKVVDILNDVLFSKLNGQAATQLDGQTMKGVQSDLRMLANNYIYGNSTASERAIGMALRETLKAFNATVRQQNPNLSSALRRIDSAYGDLDIIMRAAANSAAEGGKFSPKQYQLAVRQADATRNKRGIAKGTARNVKMADDALEVMGNYESGNSPFVRSVTRWGVPASLFGTVDPMTGLAASGATGAIYTDAGQAAIDAMLRGRPEIIKKAGDIIKRNAPYSGGMLSPKVLQEYNNYDRQERMLPEVVVTPQNSGRR